MQFIADDLDIGGFAQGNVDERQTIEADRHRDQVEFNAAALFLINGEIGAGPVRNAIQAEIKDDDPANAICLFRIADRLHFRRLRKYRENPIISLCKNFHALHYSMRSSF